MGKMAGQMVAKLRRFTNALGEGQYVPTQRFLTWALRGMTAAQSVLLSEIGRSLHDGFRSLHQVEKKLSYHVTNPRWDADKSQDRYLAHVRRWIEPDTYVAVDMGEITKSRARAMPYLTWVRDGSKKGTAEEKQALGWWKVEIEAMPKRRGKRHQLPLVDHVFSTEEPGFLSQNQVVFSTIDRVLKHTGTNGIWLEDGGFDGEQNYLFMADRKLRFVVRTYGQRNALVGERKKQIKEWAKGVRLTPTECVIQREERYGLRVGYCAVRLPFLDLPLTLIVCEGLGIRPLLLLTNVEVGSLDKATELVGVYLARWGIEEGCRFVKQTYGLENIRALSWLGIRRLACMAVWCYGFLCLLSLLEPKETIQRLIDAYPSFRAAPRFHYYRLAETVAALLGPPTWAAAQSGP